MALVTAERPGSLLVARLGVSVLPPRPAAEPFDAARVGEDAGTRVGDEAGATRVSEGASATRAIEEVGANRVSGEAGTTRVSEETGRLPVSEEADGSRGCDTGRANVGAATPTARTPAEATPPSKIRQLLTKHSTSR
jgi:hypothetical protein